VPELEKQLSIQRADMDEQDARIDKLEAKLKALAAALDRAGAAKPATGSSPTVASGNEFAGLRVTGYAQAQYEHHADSEDQLAPGGTPLNQNRFLLRRTRLKVEREWDFTSLMVEFDGNTVRGPAFGLQHAEVSAFLRDRAIEGSAPMLKVTLGLFDNPFGYELLESPRFRPFVERSALSRGFFPAEPDLGVRFSGKLAWFRYAVAAVNGQPLGDRTGFVLQDPNQHKDVVGRVGVDVEVAKTFAVAGGVSVLNGKGFHAGSDPSKSILVFTDLNENGSINPGETTILPATVGSPSLNFTRWAVGADLEFDLKTAYGRTRLYGEFTAGVNMDRGLFIADPVGASVDSRELGYYVAVVQDVTRHGLIGFRYDSYNPNSDFFDTRGGRLIPTTQTLTTYSPLVALELPERARLVFEYDFIRDSLARNLQGVPVDRKNDTWTVRLQGQL
jgi:hypothetical protein